MLEPISVPGQLNDSAVQAAVKTEYFPNQLAVIPRDGDTVTAGDIQLAWHAVDTVKYNVNLFHFAYALRKPTSNVLFWAVTVVNAPREMSGVRLAIGSNAASVWWVNGEEVIRLYNDRQAVIDDGVSNRLTLKHGPNVVRAVIINDFCARFLDAENNPVKGLARESGCEREGSLSLAGQPSRLRVSKQRDWQPERRSHHVDRRRKPQHGGTNRSRSALGQLWHVRG